MGISSMAPLTTYYKWSNRQSTGFPGQLIPCNVVLALFRCHLRGFAGDGNLALCFKGEAREDGQMVSSNRMTCQLSLRQLLPVEFDYGLLALHSITEQELPPSGLSSGFVPSSMLLWPLFCLLFLTSGTSLLYSIYSNTHVRHE